MAIRAPNTTTPKVVPIDWAKVTTTPAAPRPAALRPAAPRWAAGTEFRTTARATMGIAPTPRPVTKKYRPRTVACVPRLSAARSKNPQG